MNGYLTVWNAAGEKVCAALIVDRSEASVTAMASALFGARAIEGERAELDIYTRENVFVTNVRFSCGKSCG